ncbi:MAG: hypothetical protein WBA17_08080 [Saprospiraceae bacterium]
MQSLSIERTSEAIVIKLPLDSTAIELQNMLNYFKYVRVGGASQVTDAELEELAKDAKSSWWEKNKNRFLGKEGFEGLE